MTTTDDTSGASAAHPRFAEALRALGLGDLADEVRRFPEATRTAAEAAAAIGCELSQICKSLIFAADGVPVLVLMDGASRVDVERVREELGAGKVTRAKADVVRETTGYAIGGVPPSGTGSGPECSRTARCSPTTSYGPPPEPRTPSSRWNPRTSSPPPAPPSWTCASAPGDPAGPGGVRPARRALMRTTPVRSTLERGVPEVIVMMHTAVGWHVELEFMEDDQHTRAVAMVRLPDGTEVRAHGHASRHRVDAQQPRVGEEVAGARALNELAMRLLTKAHDEIDAASGRTSHPIHV